MYRTQGKFALVSVSEQYKHFQTILYKLFLSVSVWVSASVNTSLVAFPQIYNMQTVFNLNMSLTIVNRSYAYLVYPVSSNSTGSWKSCHLDTSDEGAILNPCKYRNNASQSENKFIKRIVLTQLLHDDTEHPEDYTGWPHSNQDVISLWFLA